MVQGSATMGATRRFVIGWSTWGSISLACVDCALRRPCQLGRFG
jgi:hypothetical protein